MLVYGKYDAISLYFTCRSVCLVCVEVLCWIDGMVLQRMCVLCL